MAKPRTRVPAALGPLAAGVLLVLGPGAISAAAMDRGASVAVEPSVRAGQSAAAAIGASQGTAAAASSSSSSNGVFWTVLGVLVLVSAAIVGFVLYSRRRRGRDAGGRSGRAAGGAPPGAPSMKDLTRQAAQLLVETDDAVKTSEEELGFAVAQFGPGPSTQFTVTLDGAKRDLAEAFRLRGRLDADPAPAEAERYRILQQVVDKCTKANAALDAQTASVERLRDLQANAPQVLDDLNRQLATAPDRIDTAVAALERAGAAYGPRALQPIAQNPGQARKLVEFAQKAIAEARRQVADGQSGQAAVATRSAQAALGQVGLLTQAVGRRLTDLKQAAAGVGTVIAEVDDELAQGRSLLEGADPASVRRLDELDEEAARIKAEVQAGPGDPLDRLARLQAVDAGLDELLLGLRSERERRAGAHAMLEQALLAARGDVAGAEDFITTRRGAIGSRARTLQAEAARQLGKALSLAQADPTAALEAARQASDHARSAQQQATGDLSGFGGGRGNFGSPAGAVGGGALGGLFGGAAAQSAGGMLRGRRAVARTGGFQGAPGYGRRGSGGRF